MSVDERHEDRRDDQMLSHAAQVWAESIADREPADLFRMGAACLDLADGATDADRRELLAAVAFSLLVYAGRHDAAIAARIEQLCERERARGENQAETSRVIQTVMSAIHDR